MPRYLQQQRQKRVPKMPLQPPHTAVTPRAGAHVAPVGGAAERRR